MAAMVTRSMCRNDVIRGVAAAVLLGFQVLGRATERATGTREKTQLLWRGLPHRKTAVVAAAGLRLECVGAQRLEAFFAHIGLWNQKTIPVPPIGEPRAPGAYWLCGHNTDALATGVRFIA